MLMKTLRWSLCILVLLMGNMAFTPVYAMGGNSSPPNQRSGANNPQRHALIIGNSSYSSTAPP